MQNLFVKYLNNQCSVEEVKALLAYFNAEENEGVLRELINESLKTNHAVAEKEEGDPNELLSQVYSDIRKQIDTNAVVVPFYKNKWFRIAAAAAILLLISVNLLRYSDNKVVHSEMAVTQKVSSDIMPGGNKAILTLADGSTIILDSAANGNLTLQGNTKVIKLDGQLAYAASGNGTEVMYNTVSTPRGGQYQLILSDGSKVWLNAASSLRFPTTFSKGERTVALTGEGYFEVAKNASKPFKVSLDRKVDVQVLGTHFNINAYSDETTINTTLLEGSVKVFMQDGQSSLLKPGQQARISDGHKVVSYVDTDEVIAWKTGWFNFNRMDVATIMRQVSRWYNVEVQFEGVVSQKSFSGIVSRNNNVSEVLNIMEKAGVKFKIEANKITVIQ